MMGHFDDVISNCVKQPSYLKAGHNYVLSKGYSERTMISVPI